MKASILVVASGAVLVLLGRWLYQNPTRLFPGWGLLNPESPHVKRLARAYATFVIFFGMLMVTAILLRGPFVILLSLPLAVVATWFLRPKLQQLTPEAPAPVLSGLGEPPKKQGLFSEHWKRNSGIILCVAVVFATGLISLMSNSEVSKLAFAKAQSDSNVRQQIGEPIKRGFSTSGTIQFSGPSGSADISFPISGPKGKATVYAVAEKSADIWTFTTLQVQVNDQKERLNLLKEPPQL